MTTISFFSSHHDPHRAPLGRIEGLDYFGDLVHEGDGSRDMIENLNSPDLLPWHWSIFQKFVDGVRGVFEGAQKDSFVCSVFSS